MVRQEFVKHAHYSFMYIDLDAPQVSRHYAGTASVASASCAMAYCCYKVRLCSL